MRSQPGKRFDVTMSMSLMKRAIHHTVTIVNQATPPPIIKQTVDNYVKWMQEISNTDSDVFSSYPILYLPPDYDMEEEPIIQQSGQHRAKALLQLYARNNDYTGYTKDLFNPNTVHVSRSRFINNCW